MTDPWDERYIYLHLSQVGKRNRRPIDPSWDYEYWILNMNCKGTISSHNRGSDKWDVSNSKLSFWYSYFPLPWLWENEIERVFQFRKNCQITNICLLYSTNLNYIGVLGTVSIPNLPVPNVIVCQAYWASQHVNYQRAIPDGGQGEKSSKGSTVFITVWRSKRMEPKCHAEEVIGLPNHQLRIWLDA